MIIVKEPRDAKTDMTYIFSVLATDVTATAPDDYTLGRSYEQIIDPQSQQLEFPILIIDDAEIEGKETFQLKIVLPHTLFRLGNITRVTVTITDDDKREDDGKEGREGRREGGREGVREGCRRKRER